MAAGWALLDASGYAVAWSPTQSNVTPGPGQSVVAADSLDAAKPLAQQLAEAKVASVMAVDMKTQVLLAAGFTYGGNTFPLDPDSRLDWKAILDGNVKTWPLSFTTTDGKTVVSLDGTTGPAAAQAAFTRYVALRQQGATLKAQINASTSVANVQAVIDDRA